MTVVSMISVLAVLLFIGIGLFVVGTVKIKQYMKLTATAILIAIPYVVINLSNSIYANNINVLNILSTILFLISWLVLGLTQGRAKNSKFIKFTLSYWFANIISAWLGLLFVNVSYGLFSLINLIPMYGIYYYIQHLSTGVNYFLLIIPLLISLIGFILGQKFVTLTNP